MNRLRKYRHWRTVTAVNVYFAASCLSLVVGAAFIALQAHLEEDAVHESYVSRRDDVGSGTGHSSPGLGDMHDGGLAPEFDVNNCTPPSIDNFPRNVMSVEVLRHGGFLVNLAAVCYIFGVLALVCDSYFMSSLDIICTDFNLSEDVAGASFMAVGGSAPELFTSIFGVFIAKGNIGVGTVIGSAVFNILCVIGLCGILAGQVVYLTKWPIARDFICYSATVVCLILVMFDNKVDWWESMILILLYIAYLVFLYFDPWVKKRVETYSMCHTVHKEHVDPETSFEGPLVGEKTPFLVNKKRSESSFGADSNENLSEPDTKPEDVEPNTLFPFVIPSGCCNRLFWAMGFPASFLFYLTIPNCSLARWRRWYPVTFVMALAWIGVVTYVLVWMVTVLGYVFSLPDTVMGLTLVAAGSSTPDTILSIAAARNGYGDMAICHSIGSNIFDILLGLGLPWFLHSAAVYQGQPVPTYSDGLTIIAGMLLATIVVALVIIKLNAFKLNKKTGVILVLFYVVFLVPAILLEMDILIKGLILPECPRSG